MRTQHIRAPNPGASLGRTPLPGRPLPHPSHPAALTLHTHPGCLLQGCQCLRQHHLGRQACAPVFPPDLLPCFPQAGQQDRQGRLRPGDRQHLLPGEQAACKGAAQLGFHLGRGWLRADRGHPAARTHRPGHGQGRPAPRGARQLRHLLAATDRAFPPPSRSCPQQSSSIAIAGKDATCGYGATVGNCKSVDT